MDIRDIVTCAELACVLEVSSKKPGNVSRAYNFKDTKYEDFLASGIAIGRAIEGSAKRGRLAALGDIDFQDIGIGELIKAAVTESKRWHHGKNTNLGIAMLLVPLSAACGAWVAVAGEGDGEGDGDGKGNVKDKKVKDRVENERIREYLDIIIKNTTYKDTIKLYETINLVRPGGMGRTADVDVYDKRSIDHIKEKGLNLYDIMKITKSDSIAAELVTGMEKSFETGYPAIAGEFDRTGDINKAVVYGFMAILSRCPDSHIARKNGADVAEEISREAAEIFKRGMDKRELEQFDKRLRDKENRLNPGSTADLVTSSLMIALLNGLRV